MIDHPTLASVAEKQVPKVSIGMPVFNGEKFIRDALDSLLAQTFTNCELIISDNASTDSTEAICREYAAKDRRIRYVRQAENLGPFANFKYVLDEAVGEYFMWAAADDVWQSDWIECLLPEIKDDVICAIGTIGGIIDTQVTDSTILLKSYKHGSLVRCFLADESKRRCMYVYGVYKTKKLRMADFHVFASARYWSDSLFIFSILKFGGLKSVGRSKVYKRAHRDNMGSVIWKEYYDWRRLIFMAYPWNYYSWHIRLSDWTNASLIVLLIPVKHLSAQFGIWRRGVCALLFNFEHLKNRIRETLTNK